MCEDSWRIEIDRYVVVARLPRLLEEFVPSQLDLFSDLIACDESLSESVESEGYDFIWFEPQGASTIVATLTDAASGIRCIRSAQTGGLGH